MYVTLPIGLKDEIDIAVSTVSGNQSIMKNNSYEFFYETVSDSVYHRGLPGFHVHYDHATVRSKLGRNYSDLLKAFEARNLVAVDTTAIKGVKARGYQVNSTFLDDTYVTLSIPKNLSESVNDATEQIIRHCSIDVTSASEEILRFANSEDLFNDVKIDDQISKDVLGRVRVFSNITGQFNSDELKFIRKDVLLDKFGTDGFSLIKQDKRYYYMPLNLYKSMRKERVLFSYNGSLARIEYKDIHTSRDERGNRLHSNITNIPSRLLKFLTYNGEHFVELDLKNSQWCFLVYCLNNPELNNIISGRVKQVGFNFQNVGYKQFGDSPKIRTVSLV